MTSLASYVVIFCLRLPYALNFEILYFWTDLVEIWLRGQILGVDSESEVTFYIRGKYQADLGHFLQFCLGKSNKHSLIIVLLWQQLKSQINKTYIFGCSLYIDSNIL